MDPVSIIVAALVKGILQSVGEQAARDCYQTLKNLILRRYQRISIDKLEENPQSKARQAVVEEDLRNAGAGQDDEILQLAQELLNLINNHGNASGQPGNKAAQVPEEVFERAERNGGSQAIRQIIDKHIGNVMHVRVHFPVSDQDLLSAKIVRAQSVPDPLRSDIGLFHNKIKTIIQQIAFRIEERKYKTAEEAINNMHFALADRHRANQLVQADKKVHVSYQALKTTVEFFAELNQIIIDKIERADSLQPEANLLLGNAVLVYELTDYVIGYIENFTVYGIDEILKLHEEAKQKVAELRRQQSDLEQQLQSKSVDQDVKDQIIKDIRMRERSINLFEQEWINYVEMITSLQGEVLKIHDKIPTLEAIRENAKVQINLIQAVAMLQILKQSIGTMKATIITLGSMKLASLSPNRVRRLLGIS